MRDGIPGNSESEEELRAKFAREIADTFIYLSLTAQRAGVRLSEIVPDVFDAKSRKIGYPVMIGTAAVPPSHPDPDTDY